MKKICYTLFSFLVLLSINSCSSIISKEDCKKDMHSLGLDHGKRGFVTQIEEIRRICSNSENLINLESYNEGFQIGWSIFCTPAHGYEMGEKGDSYKSFCPKDKEDLFHEKFLIGKKINTKRDQVSELEDKIKDFSQTSEKDPSMKEELIQSEASLLALKREIQSLEQKGMSPIHTN